MKQVIRSSSRVNGASSSTVARRNSVLSSAMLTMFIVAAMKGNFATALTV